MIRVRLSLQFDVGRRKSEPASDDRPAFVATPGEHLDAGSTPTDLGFVPPGRYPTDPEEDL